MHFQKKRSKKKTKQGKFMHTAGEADFSDRLLLYIVSQKLLLSLEDYVDSNDINNSDFPSKFRTEIKNELIELDNTCNTLTEAYNPMSPPDDTDNNNIRSFPWFLTVRCLYNDIWPMLLKNTDGSYSRNFTTNSYYNKSAEQLYDYIRSLIAVIYPSDNDNNDQYKGANMEEQCYIKLINTVLNHVLEEVPLPEEYLTEEWAQNTVKAFDSFKENFESSRNYKLAEAYCYICENKYNYTEFMQALLDASEEDFLRFIGPLINKVKSGGKRKFRISRRR